MARREVLISVDVEADGPIPGRYSMSSFGACVFATATRAQPSPVFEAVPVDEVTFYAELKPISDVFDPGAAAVAGLDRSRLITDGEEPSSAMSRFVSWVESARQRFGGTPVFVAWPVPYDWMWVYWYLIEFVGESPFGHSRALDAKAFFAGRAGSLLTDVGKRDVVKALEFSATRRHTHHALEDAQEQGELFQQLLPWFPT